MKSFETHIFEPANFIDLFPIQCGYEKCSPMHSIGPTTKENYLFHYVISGKGYFFPVKLPGYEKEKIEIKTGEGFLIAPETISSYQSDNDNPWEYLWIEFNGLKASELITKAGLDVELIFINKVKNDYQLQQHLTYIVENYNHSLLELVGYLYLVLNYLIEHSVFTKDQKYDDTRLYYVQQAVNFIKKNYTRNITVTDLAKWCNLDRSYFGKIFKEVMNITPQQFIVQYRLKKSCEFLLDSNLSIKEISDLLGYNNQFYFSQVFKKKYGLSPRAWRIKN